jgi:hypothetical protein
MRLLVERRLNGFPWGSRRAGAIYSRTTMVFRIRSMVGSHVNALSIVPKRSLGTVGQMSRSAHRKGTGNAPTRCVPPVARRRARLALALMIEETHPEKLGWPDSVRVSPVDVFRRRANQIIVRRDVAAERGSTQTVTPSPCRNVRRSLFSQYCHHAASRSDQYVLPLRENFPEKSCSPQAYASAFRA